MLADEPRVAVPIGMIKRQAAQLTRLVDDLLDIARITQGRIELRRTPLELAAVIAQAVETVAPQLRQKEHGLTIVSSYEPLYVNGDFARLVQCVVNVLANAGKYTDGHGTIRVETRAENSNAVIQITDNGVGIAPEMVPHIFDLFVQGNRTLDRAQGGLGIGLSIVKRLLEMHDGEVSASSPGLGHGSTFEMRLPRIARPETSPEPEPRKIPFRRILIVDDNADAAKSLALLLDLSGHETLVALSSREALARFETFRPDVALLDIGLPEMNGYELVRHLRTAADRRRVRLIALTGYGQSQDRQRALDAGFDDHLVKPVDLAALERTIAGSMDVPTSAAGG
jgi:CheY-like chemotaxis protein